MPNWCQNTLTLYHEDPKMIDELENKLKLEEPEIFKHLRPMPQNEEDWYSWNVEHWGTKWDASVMDSERVDENTINIVMDTAWSPPVRLYDHLVDEGYGVDAHYLEEGMGFVGRYFNGDDEEYELDYSISTLEEFKKGIPQECIDHWGLDMQWEDNREFNNEIDEMEKKDDDIIH